MFHPRKANHQLFSRLNRLFLNTSIENPLFSTHQTKYTLRSNLSFIINTHTHTHL